MEKLNKIIQHPKYKEYLARIAEYEKKRVFCKHDMVHFLDVCRLAEILWLREKQDSQTAYMINSELLYAAGLLHDIGRWKEYESGIRHEIASAELAPEILEECGFSYEDRQEILRAIRNHRNKEIKQEFSVAGILYRADKMSRPCFACKAEAECDWDLNKKNMQIIY